MGKSCLEGTEVATYGSAVRLKEFHKEMEQGLYMAKTEELGPPFGDKTTV